MRPEIDEIIGRADGVFVVLDDDDGVAEVAQFAQRGQQPLVVALVQADARLVEDVEDAGELRADLRGEPDALRLAAGERAAFAVEREVTEPNLIEKTEPQQDFPPHLATDFFLRLAKRPGVQPALGGGDGEMAELRDVESRAGRTADGDGEHLGPQARAVAGAAGDADHDTALSRWRVSSLLLSAWRRVSLRDQALERPLGGDLLPPRVAVKAIFSSPVPSKSARWNASLVSRNGRDIGSLKAAASAASWPE